MATMTTASFRGTVGMAIVYVLAAASGATILITRVVKGDSGFGILAAAAILLTFGVLAVTSWRNALRLRRQQPGPVGSSRHVRSTRAVCTSTTRTP